MTDTKVQTAIVSTEKGKAEVRKTVAVKKPADDQVLVKVAAVGLNPVDWKILNYNFFGLSYPFTLPGIDVSGTVVEVGKDVKDFKVGDEVFGHANPLRGSATFAEYTVVEAARIAHKGSKLTHVQAAALPVAFLSAWNGIDAKMEAKQTILIPGGAGGVGHFMVQLSKILGLTVIATAGSDDSIKLLKEYKVDHILNYKTDDIVSSVLKLTDNKGVDWAYDATYVESSITACTKAVKEGGTVIVLGAGNVPKDGSEAQKTLASKKANCAVADLVDTLSETVPAEKLKNKLVKGLEAGVKYFEEGKMAPNITKIVSLNEVIDLLIEWSKGKSFQGKVVLDMTK